MTTKRPIALVSGGRQGLGRAIALNMAARGFDIALLDLQRDEKAETTLGEIEAAGAKSCFIAMDLADIEGHAAAIDQVEAALGPIDSLVNNAGIAARPLTDLLDLGPEAFDRNIAVNLRGSFFLTQAVSRRMLEQKSEAYRSITFITSIAANFISTDRSQYCVSKAGLSMVVKLYADRLAASKIAVHEVRPGFIRTEMTGSAPVEKIDNYMTNGDVAMRRWGEADDIGRVVATLSSGDLPYVTGQPIYVDGGFHLPTV